jgi:hypothetical protein
MKHGAVILGLIVALTTSPAAAERIFGLVIGIDEYAYIPDLHGAVNDAEDIADALQGLGADVTLLLDHEATRDAILDGWERILQQAAPGDRLIVSYAGHGSNEPEHIPGSEADGRDENFLLAGFAPRGEAAAQRIRDDEIADLLARSAELDVIFIADACHAGTVTRHINPVLGYRYVTPERLEADPLPPPPPLRNADEGSDQVALFLAAVNETEKVPEFLIDGIPRGALSYAVASGLRGAADYDGDGTLTKGELETHVRRTVREVSDGVQLPQSLPAGREDRSLLAIDASDDEVPAATFERPLTERPFPDLPPVSVHWGSGWTGITGIDTTETGSLRFEDDALISSIGDLVAQATAPNDIQAVIDKHRLVAALRRIAHPTLRVGFDKGDRTYRYGDRFAIEITGRGTPHVTLFNLAADGTIAFLYPVRDPAAGLDDPMTIAAGHTLDLPVKVAPPFGADHVVVIETDTAPTRLRAELVQLSGSRDMARLWDLLRQSGGRIALFPFFTSDDV